jgi:hypothetical protein
MYAEIPEERTDPRNKDSWEACKKITETLKDIYLPII